MKFTHLTGSTLLFVAVVLAATPQFFPLTRNGEIPVILPYALGEEVFIDCISRNINNGEHNFDSNNRIIYKAFPTCKETGRPLALRYGVSENVNCTVTFSDELYHLFQLYVHEDAPLSCRIPVSAEPYYLESGGAYIPLTFNFRGEVHKAHMDIDTKMNMIVTRPSGSKPEQQTVLNAVAWSAGTNGTRLTIGESLTMEFAVRWINSIKPVGSRGTDALPFTDGFYRLPMATIPISYMHYVLSLVLTVIVSGTISGLVSYNLKKHRSYHSLMDKESGLAKQD